MVAASATLAGRTAISTLRAEQGDVTHRTEEDLRIGRRQGYRLAAVEVAAPDGVRTVYVATSLELLRESVATVRDVLLLGIPLLVVVAAVTTWSFVGRALRPVGAISERVQRITQASLDERVPVPRAADEVSRLARTMNDMLARLDSAAKRQRRFVEDASHELRTPLAAAMTDLVGCRSPTPARGTGTMLRTRS